MLNLKDLSDFVESSRYGIFTDKGFLESQTGIEIERIKGNEKGGFYLQTRIKNVSTNSININSILVAEFLLHEDLHYGKILEHGWLQCSEVGYRNLGDVTRMLKVFLQRDQNPNSFKPEYGYVEESIVSEWFTTLDIDSKTLLIGAVTTGNQFSTIYIKDKNGEAGIRVITHLDGLAIKPGMVVVSEKIFFALDEDSVVKKDFADSLAKNMKVKKVEPVARGMCNSYYWNGNKIDENLINEELDALEDLPGGLNLDYFQLDAGYTDFFGDWLDYKKRFPNGFGGIVKRIESLGYKPGIWLSPFAINPATKLHDHHPSWLLKGEHKPHFEGRMTSPFDNLMNVLDLEVMDPTKKEVQDYLAKVFTHFKDLGFRLFKIDFMYPVCLASNFAKPVTRAQALRIGVEHIKNVLGSECTVLTGITQIAPVVGLADFVRTGIDTLNPFVCGIPGISTVVNEFMLEKNIEETKARLFLNGKVWRGDPDVLVFRQGTGLNPETIQKHKKLVKDNNLSLWVGDSVARMDVNTQKDLVQFFR